MANIENEVKIVLPSETQAKFFPQVDERQLDGFFDRVVSLFEFAGFSVERQALVQNRDSYYDTDSYSLDRARFSLRVRETGGTYQYCLKMPSDSSVGVQKRREIESEVSPEELDALKRDNFRSLSRVHFSEYEDERFSVGVIVNTERRQFYAERRDSRYKVCLDSIVYETPDSRMKSGHEIELEIEAKSEVADLEIDSLKILLIRIFPEFEYADSSKYSRGANFVRRVAKSFPNRVLQYVQDNKLVALSIVLLGVLGSIASIVGLF